MIRYVKLPEGIMDHYYISPIIDQGFPLIMFHTVNIPCITHLPVLPSNIIGVQWDFKATKSTYPRTLTLEILFISSVFAILSYRFSGAISFYSVSCTSYVLKWSSTRSEFKHVCFIQLINMVIILLCYLVI